MNAAFLLTWLAGTLLPLGALWLVWRLALRGERCFGYNRALLLLAPVAAVGLPLLPHPLLPAWLSGGPVDAAPVAVLLPALPAVVASPVPAANWSILPWLLVFYLAGVILGLGRLLWQAERLWWLARHLPRFEFPQYALVHTGGQLPTSSFGRVVFWDETTCLGPAEMAVVLAHEVAHVRQRHTLDVWWLEIWRIVLWPNPFAHLLLPALRLTHELLADREAAASTGAATPYSLLLARLAARQFSGPASSMLLQPFTFSFTLTRIAMLKNQTPVHRWKQWLALPLLGGLSFVAGLPASAQTGRAQVDPVPSEAEQQARLAYIHRLTREAFRRDSLRGPISPDSTREVILIKLDGTPPTSTVRVVRVKKGQFMRPDGTLENRPPTGPSKPGVYTYVEQMPQLPGGGNMAAVTAAIQQNFVYPAGSTKEGVVFAKFTVNADGTVSDATIIKGLTSTVDEAVLAAIRLLPRFVPGKQNGQAVAVSYTVPIKLALKR